MIVSQTAKSQLFAKRSRVILRCKLFKKSLYWANVDHRVESHSSRSRFSSSRPSAVVPFASFLWRYVTFACVSLCYAKNSVTVYLVSFTRFSYKTVKIFPHDLIRIPIVENRGLITLEATCNKRLVLFTNEYFTVRFLK